MSDDEEEKVTKVKLDVDWSWSWFFIAFFVVFWSQSGWYRVDCALKVEKACNLIQAEYDNKAKP